jgi:hypothetical protein
MPSRASALTACAAAEAGQAHARHTQGDRGRRARAGSPAPPHGGGACSERAGARRARPYSADAQHAKELQELREHEQRLVRVIDRPDHPLNAKLEVRGEHNETWRTQRPRCARCLTSAPRQNVQRNIRVMNDEVAASTRAVGRHAAHIDSAHPEWPHMRTGGALARSGGRPAHQRGPPRGRYPRARRLDGHPGKARSRPTVCVPLALTTCQAQITEFQASHGMVGVGKLVGAVCDVERRASLRLRLIRHNPLVRSLCCDVLHCFHCQVRVPPTGHTPGVDCSRNLAAVTDVRFCPIVRSPLSDCHRAHSDCTRARSATSP